VRALSELPGLNNVGLLVRVCGRVARSGAGTFVLDDGSKYDDGDPAVPA